jgi:regulator of protease activity HflC (stomatin/prohibitin superfamily)
MIRERVRRTISGWIVAPLLLVALATLIWTAITWVDNGWPGGFAGVAVIAAFPLLILLTKGFFIVNPNDARVLLLFGAYAGSVKHEGFHWANPLLSGKRLSLRVRNFESSKIKVNDHDGNPIEIAAVVVWRVVETAEASFEVDDYEHYVKVQSEAAVRNLSTQYPYDSHLEGERSLRGNTAEIAEQLKTEVQERLSTAGVSVLEARINHLAYSPEIAAAMLQRQQAGAIIAARQRIVEGAVGMVEMALEMLSHRSIVELDNERKAAMVSNLLVVLCGDRNTQPVINAGTIYQ